MSRFEIKAKDGMARLGRYTTEHGTVKTPLLMPVVHPGKSEISSKDLLNIFGFQMIITNSYIIKSNDRFNEIALSEGVHGLLDFSGPIMTDSGTFQMYFHKLPEKEIDPLEIIEFQKNIGSDIGTILDVFSSPDVSKVKVEADVKLSLERAKKSISKKGDMLLAGTVQGGVYPDIRENSAFEMGKLDFDVYPIGGIVPLMERYRYSDIIHAVMASKKHLPLDKPVHLFGAGHPMMFAQAALLGCDFFDSASYAKFATTGRMLLSSGTVHLEDLTELPCDCPICSTTSADELKSLKKDEKALHLMKHNLFVSAGEIRRVRQAILDGKLMQLAAIRARGHPALYEAFHVMLNYSNQIVQSDPIGNSNSVFYTGMETSRLPVFQRFHQKIIKTYPYRETETLILVPDSGNNPFSDVMPNLVNSFRKSDAGKNILVFVTPIGVVPWELEHVFPAQQSVFPNSLDSITMANTVSRVTNFLQIVKADRVIWTSRSTPINSVYDDLSEAFEIEAVEGVEKSISEIKTTTTGEDWVKRKIRALFPFQWGISGEGILHHSEFKVSFSRKTGKIRHIQNGDDILFTLVPTTGLLTPTFKGAQALLQEGLPERFTVVVDDDSAEFVKKGKSALAKFIVQADKSLNSGEEVLLLDKTGSLLATGRTLLTGAEMLAFSRGVAVIPRHREH
ncbi:MAG: tRNA guanosine(15) transglycosylase TgtA [Candidatus Thorarchaeota archaeon]